MFNFHSPTAAVEGEKDLSPSPPAFLADDSEAADSPSGQTIGHGDGLIHVIPSLSSPVVKNGDKVTISAVVKAQAGIEKVEAVIDLGNVAQPPSAVRNDPVRGTGVPPVNHGQDAHATVETIPLSPSNSSNVSSFIPHPSSFPVVGLFRAEWTGHDLEEKYYTVTIRVTDRNGHVFEDRSLQFSDPIAGINTPGTTNYPNGGMQWIGELPRTEWYPACAAIDPAGGFAYFGIDQSPAMIVKVRLSDFTRVGTLALRPGEDSLISAAIDSTAGYAYFGTNTDPGIVIKVSLNGTGIPIRVGALTLNTGEGGLKSAVIDPAGGYVYFGTWWNTPAKLIKVALNGNDVPTRIGTLPLNAGENMISSAVIDPAAGFAYLGVSTSGVGKIVKVGLNGSGIPWRVGALTLNSSENFPESAVIDPVAGYAYFGVTNNSMAGSTGRVVKVRFNGTGVPIRVGALTLNSGEDNLRSAVIDTTAGYAYLTSNLNVAVKVALNGAGVPIRVGATGLGSGCGAQSLCAVIDPAAGFAYFGNAMGCPNANVIKVALNGAGVPVLAGALDFVWVSEENYTCAVVDPVSECAYFGTDTYPACIVKFAFNGAGLPLKVGTLNLDWLTDEKHLHSAAIDVAGGFAYFGTDTSPGKIIKVALNGTGLPTKVGTITLNTGENSLYSSVIDPAGGYVYFGTKTAPGKVVKIDTNGTTLPLEVGTLTLNAGEDNLRSGAMDPSTGYAYFGSDTSPGKVVKVDLNGTTVPLEVGTLTLNTGENSLYEGVIDPSAGYAYFGTHTVPGQVVKVDLNGTSVPLEIGALTLNPGEDNLNAAVIDPASGFSYFGTETYPGIVVKVALNGAGIPMRAGALTLDKGEFDLACGVIDSSAGFAYFGGNTLFGAITKIGFGQRNYIKGTKISLPVGGTVSDINFFSHTAQGNVRLGIFEDSAPRTLLWDSNSTSDTATGAWITVPISNGNPNALTLPPGNYQLAWQIDANADIPSYTAGTDGDGFFLPQGYGNFPSQLNPLGPVLSSERWSVYITYATPNAVRNWEIYE